MTIHINADKLNDETVTLVSDISGENLYACYQCGNCSSSCPMADYMDILPQRAIRLIQLGEVADLLKANTMWICAACVSCRVKCPKGVDFSKIAEGLRQIVIRMKENHVELHLLPKDVVETYPQIALVANLRKFSL
jgi:heterodisulfide reductase subunit C2